MKEFLTDFGGRRVFNEDFLHLQDLALSASQFLNTAETDFVIYGCGITTEAATNKEGLDVTVITIGEGYVFMKGKIRHVEHQRVETSTIGYAGPFYVIEDNSYGPKVIYASGMAKEMFFEYGAKLSLTKPDEGNIGFIELTDKDDESQSFRRKFLGSFCLLKEDYNPDDFFTKYGGSLYNDARIILQSAMDEATSEQDLTIISPNSILIQQKSSAAQTLITGEGVITPFGTFSGRYLSDGARRMAIADLFKIIDGLNGGDGSIITVLDNYLPLSGGVMDANAIIKFGSNDAQFNTYIARNSINIVFDPQQSNANFPDGVFKPGISDDIIPGVGDGTVTPTPRYSAGIGNNISGVVSGAVTLKKCQTKLTGEAIIVTASSNTNYDDGVMLSDGQNAMAISELLVQAKKMRSFDGLDGYLSLDGGVMNDNASVTFFKQGNIANYEGKPLENANLRTIIQPDVLVVRADKGSRTLWAQLKPDHISTTGMVEAEEIRATKLTAKISKSTVLIKDLIDLPSLAMKITGAVMNNNASIIVGSTTVNGSKVKTSTFEGSTLSDGQGRSISISALIANSHALQAGGNTGGEGGGTVTPGTPVDLSNYLTYNGGEMNTGASLIFKNGALMTEIDGGNVTVGNKVKGYTIEGTVISGTTLKGANGGTISIDTLIAHSHTHNSDLGGTVIPDVGTGAAMRTVEVSCTKSLGNVVKGNSVSGSGQYVNNTAATLIATAGAKFRFNKWIINDSQEYTENPLTIKVDKNINAFAEMKQTQVNINYKLSIPGTASLWYGENRLVSIGGYTGNGVRDVETGYKFDRWVDENGETVSDKESNGEWADAIVVMGTLDRDEKTYTAIMKKMDDVYVTISVFGAVGGSIQIGNSESVNNYVTKKYAYNTKVALYAVPQEGYQFQHWKKGADTYATTPDIEIKATELATYSAVFAETNS